MVVLGTKHRARWMLPLSCLRGPAALTRNFEGQGQHGESNCYSNSAHNTWEEDNGSKTMPWPPEIRGKEKHPSLGERFAGDEFSEKVRFKPESKGLKPEGDTGLRKEHVSHCREGTVKAKGRNQLSRTASRLEM